MNGPDSLAERVRSVVRDVPDFPKAGILFRDLTPVLAHPRLPAEIVEYFAARFHDAGVEVVAAVEARGFLFGAPLAIALGVGFVPVRKPGKLPSRTLRAEYALEYGQDALEAHADAIEPGARVLLVDDLLATGGTAAAATDLLRRLRAEVVASAFVVELDGLGGRAKLNGVAVDSLVRYG